MEVTCHLAPASRNAPCGGALGTVLPKIEISELPGELCTYKIQYHKYVLRDADTTSTDRTQESAPSRCAYSSTPTTRLTDVLPSAAVQRWSRQDTCRSAGGSCQCVRKFVRTPLDANSHLRLAHANTASSVASHGAVASARSDMTQAAAQYYFCIDDCSSGP